jgi:prepilin-type N-terminal cleavage/methylation domain-containing protein
MKALKNRKAFTLIELIIVVSVIAILMSIIIPSSQKGFTNARKTKAHCRYYQDNGFIPSAASSVDLAEKFAQEGELNNAGLFVFPGDSKAAAVSRENIWPLGKDTEPTHAWETGKQLSVQLVGNIIKEVNQSTTPVVVSRGLTDTGVWSRDGVWGTDGGFIGFIDGQVRWYKSIANKLSIETTSTSSITAVMTDVGGTLYVSGT